MTDPKTNSEDTLRKLSRRNWLRDSAITAVVLLPSLAGCRKLWDFSHGHGGHGGGGVGAEELTIEELQNASQNLQNMFLWVENLYPYSLEYESIVYNILKSGQKPTGWKQFIVNVFTEMGLGIFEAATDEIPGAGAAIALAAENIKKWASGDRPPDLKATYTEFMDGHQAMQKAITDTLLILGAIGHPDTDPAYPYQNLKQGFKQDINFNGRMYNLRDLASSHFPSIGNGDDFIRLRDAAFIKFKQHMWNVMLIKAGTMTYSSGWYISCGHFVVGTNPNAMSPSKYAADVHYKDSRYKSTYLRGYWSSDTYQFRYWYFLVDGRELSAEAAGKLFKDDYPGHIINPDGLFFRDYVFKQFHTKKPNFSDSYGIPYHELLPGTDDPYCSDTKDFNRDADNYVFTGGDMLQLTQP